MLRIDLADLSLTLAPGFAAKMSRIAALDQLPAVFFANRVVTAATASLPVTLVVHFSPWPLVGALSAALGVPLLAGLLLILLRREREYLVSLAGEMRRVRLRPLQVRRVTLPDGRVFAVRGRLFGSPAVRAPVVRPG